MSRRLSLTLVLLTLLLSSAALWAASPAAADNSLSKVDALVLADTEGSQSTHFLVVLAEQADLSGAAALATKPEKTAFVVERLRETAARTQPAVTGQLDSLGVPYRPYWITNMVAVEGDRSVVEALAANPAVARIDHDRAVQVLDPMEVNAEAAPDAPLAPEWGIVKINAPQVWALGFNGEGIVVANQDTGLKWDHAAIQSHYRGWNGTTADHNYHWWDAIHADIDGDGTNTCGFNLAVPCDDNGHGTHTAGTNVGDDGGTNQIGVAPGAKLIGCRNMEAGTGRPSTYTECFQFFAAPTDLTGANPNPALAADVVSNSWGCPHGPPPSGEDCVVNSFKTTIEAMRAAGIMVVVSNGNSGSACATTLAPPSYLDAATSVGATDSSDNIASFSSRGPVTADGSNRIKPDISAPGVSVRSSLRTGGYGNLSGTSMAAPHVAGAVALLWDARPTLMGDVDATEAALFTTALDRTTTQNCGGVTGTSVPNNTYGYGRLDILAAVNAVPTTALTVGTLGSASSPTPWLGGLVALGVVGALAGLALRRR